MKFLRSIISIKYVISICSVEHIKITNLEEVIKICKENLVNIFVLTKCINETWLNFTPLLSYKFENFDCIISLFFDISQ